MVSRAERRRRERVQSGQELAMRVFFQRLAFREHVDKLAREYGPEAVQELVDQVLLGHGVEH